MRHTNYLNCGGHFGDGIYNTIRTNTNTIRMFSAAELLYAIRKGVRRELTYRLNDAEDDFFRQDKRQPRHPLVSFPGSFLLCPSEPAYRQVLLSSREWTITAILKFKVSCWKEKILRPLHTSYLTLGLPAG